MSPRRWESICLFNKDSTPPGITELKATLDKAMEYVCSKAKVCLFIDGLDEFEGESEDLMSLVTWVKTLVEVSPVKLCVASRPWRVFEDALQDRPHLLMEDFNFKDIQQYVWKRFHDDDNFRAKRQMEATFCNQLLDEIVTKADGVFLWVHLVCSSLLQAMSRGDLAGDLRRILTELPVQMEKLYGHILENLDLKDHAAKYFMLLQACLERPDALTFSFADDIGEDGEFSLKMTKESLTGAELQYRATELRKRLNSRCKGILSLSMQPLELIDNPLPFDIETVQYCHRSAKDYLTIDANKERLIRMLEAPFDPHLRLCSAYLARWKCFLGTASKAGSFTSIYTCAEHAAKVANESSDMMIRVLDDLDPDLDYASHRVYVGRHWFGGNLLSLAVILGISEYVKHKIQRGQGCVVRSSSVHTPSRLDRIGSETIPGRRERFGRSTNKQWAELRPIRPFILPDQAQEVAWPLLLDALFSPLHPNPEMVSLLLENGADPNSIIVPEDGKSQSVLHMALSRVGIFSADVPSKLPDVKEAWVDSFCILLQYGAKPDRSDLRFLRNFIGEDVVHARKLPHLGRHRKFISNHLHIGVTSRRLGPEG